MARNVKEGGGYGNDYLDLERMVVGKICNDDVIISKYSDKDVRSDRD
jgi:hypothetical protein